MRPFNYIIPPEWRTVHLSGDLSAQATELAEEMISAGNSETLHHIRGKIAEALAIHLISLADLEAFLLLMEVDAVAGIRTGTFLAALPFPYQEGEDPMDTLLAIAASTPGAQALEGGDLLIMRTRVAKDCTDSINTALVMARGDLGLDLSTLTPGSAVRSERLTYYLGHPDIPDSWFTMVGNITTHDDADGQALAGSLRDVCDAVVESVRFS